MSELRECPKETMDNDGRVMPVPELEPCPFGGVPDVGFIGNHCHKKQVVKIFCTEFGCQFEQRVGILRNEHTTEWALGKCAKKWNHRPTEDRLREELNHKNRLIGAFLKRREALKATLSADPSTLENPSGTIEAAIDEIAALRQRVGELEDANEDSYMAGYEAGKIAASAAQEGKG